jgi:cold shock CspA family protein
MEHIEQKQTGVVEWFDQNKGCGVIKQDNGETYFVHTSNVSGDPHLLQQGVRVKYFIRPSAHKQGRLEDHEVELVLSIYQVAKNLDVGRHWEKQNWRPERWRLWSDPVVRIIHPELESNFDIIEIRTGLRIIELEMEEIQCLLKLPMSYGAFQKDSAWDSWGANRSGTIATFGDDQVTLIVHAFKKSLKAEVNNWCWRAIASHPRSSTIVGMPDKHDSFSGKGEPRSWYQNFDVFLYDLCEMITTARQGNQTRLREI